MWLNNAQQSGGRMMSTKKEIKEVVEIFRIHAKNFDLWGTLSTLEDGGYIIYGSARFKNGERSCFFSDGTDRAGLRNRMLSACRPIAIFYGAEVQHRKVDGRGSGEIPHPLLAHGNGQIH